MVRVIFVPTQNTLTLTLPYDYVGKQIEVLAFEVDKAPAVVSLSAEEHAQRIAAIRKIFDGAHVDLSNFKFNRNEANDYDE